MITTERAIYSEIKKIPKEQLGEFLKIAKSFNNQTKSKDKEPDTMSGLFEDEPDEILGMFENEPELIDQVCEWAMESREKHGLRVKA
ncbi:MAG: hypothetical protein HUU50_19335 [Candidatus Brocadiae bacterium]|nr:hypothetical protein [Candidatus Brocadiia bacterium]